MRHLLVSLETVRIYLFRTNLLVSLEAVKAEVLAEDAEALLFLLQEPCLGVAHLLVQENAELYLTNLLDFVEGKIY